MRLFARVCMNPNSPAECQKNFDISRRGGLQSKEAVMASVTREEFKIRSELEVVHIPTGAVSRGQG